MKRFLIVILALMIYPCANVMAVQPSPPPPPPHLHHPHGTVPPPQHMSLHGPYSGHHSPRYNNAYHNGCNCSNSRVLLYEENFDEKTPFADCKEHSLITHTRILHYSDGSAQSYNKYSILNDKGEILSDDLTYVKHHITTDGKHYFIAKNPAFSKRNYIIIDSKGNSKTDTGYKNYKFLGQDRLIVKQDGKYGIIDYNENPLTDIKYNSIKQSGKLLITKYNGFFGLTDENGKKILENEYDKITKNGNVFILKKNHKYGLTDLKGEILHQTSFDKIKKEGDYIKFKKNKKYGILDKNGDIIAPAEYKKVRIERNNPEVFENKIWKSLKNKD